MLELHRERNIVDKPNRVPQIYGYTVCLVAVITLLISANSLVQNAFTMANPLQGGQSRFGGEPSITSFEAYRATYERERAGPGPDSKGPIADTASETTMRMRYEALRTDRIERARFESLRSVTSSLLLLALSITLFTLHWRWLRAKERSELMGNSG